MAIALIDDWLADPSKSYKRGLQLYEQFGDNALTLSLLRHGHDGSQYHFNRLRQSLEELKGKIAQAKKEPKTIVAPKTTGSVLDLVPKLNEIHVPAKKQFVGNAEWEKLPDQIKDLFTMNSRLHSHTIMLFNQSRITQNAEDRYVLDRQILIERDQLNKNWKTIKDFQERGTLKEEIGQKHQQSIDAMSIADLVKLSRNIPPNLSKARKRLATMADGSQKNKLITKIMELEAQQDMVKKRLEGK